MQQFVNTKVKSGKLDGSGGLSPKTMKNMYNMLHKALNQAAAVVLPKRKKVEMRYFTAEEQKQLQEVIKGHRLEMPILLDLYTELRQGELLGLVWKNVHIDLNGQSYVRITQTLNRIKNPDSDAPNKTILTVNEPKTKHSFQTIPCLRHTFATRSLESGMNVKTLSKLLGHSNVGFTMDVYTHITEQLQIEEISGLQDFL